MKKFLVFLLVLTASVGTIFADGIKIGDLYYNLDATNKTAEVTYENYWDGTNYSGLTTANIPSSVDYESVTYSVTSIGDYAFYSCTGLTPVTIPNSVTWIGDFAFYKCSGLTSIEIPNSVTSIGDEAFYGCTGLTTPVYNAHVFAYMPTSYSGKYSIPEGMESIAGGAFEGCKSLTSVTIPNSVTSIGGYAFYECSGLTSVTIPNSVTSIGDYAFSWCTGLTSVTIGNSVTEIGDWAFLGCSGLTSITCEASTPPACGSIVFYEVKSIPLYVPAGSEEAYAGADEWKEFTNIQAIKTTGLEEVSGLPADDSSRKTLHNGQLLILRDGKTYTIQGAEVR